MKHPKYLNFDGDISDAALGGFAWSMLALWAVAQMAL